VDIVAEIRAAKELSDALGCVVRHFAADRQFVCLDGRAADDGPTMWAERAGEMDVRSPVAAPT
jgi:hypothetical protein